MKCGKREKYNKNDLQYEGRARLCRLARPRTPQVQVFGYNAGLLSPERAFLYAHATRCAKRCYDCCRYRCYNLNDKLNGFLFSHGILNY